MSDKRKAISKKLRFEVFKRDSFTCQYCGKAAPDALLVLDHIEPISKGGKTSILNLVTSCDNCNQGKGATQLSDSTVLSKQREQLKGMQERREQLEMMVRWQKDVGNIDNQAVNELSNYWSELNLGWSLTESGVAALRKLYRRFGVSRIMESMRVAIDSYQKLNGKGKTTSESADIAWSKLPGICYLSSLGPDGSPEREIYKIKAYIQKRFDLFRTWEQKALLEKAVKAGVPIDVLWLIARKASRTSWNDYMENAISGAKKCDPE